MALSPVPEFAYFDHNISTLRLAYIRQSSRRIAVSEIGDG